MVLSGIQRENLAQWWPVAWPMLEPAVRITGQHDEGDVLEELYEGSFQLWLVMDGAEVKAAVVTEISDWPAIREAAVRYCGGAGVDQWVYLLSVIEDWARSNGCKKLYASGRRGWVKKLPAYQEQAVVLVKDL